MAAPLSVFAKEEQRGVIRFLWSEGETGAESMEDYQLNMGTELYHGEVYTNVYECPWNGNIRDHQ